MSKRRNDRSLGISSDSTSVDTTIYTRNRKRIWALGGLALVSLLTVVVYAKNGWFGNRSELGAVATGFFSSVFPTPTPTPQLSKEYIYAGSRLLAVEDANASAVPPADLAIWRPSSGGWWILGGENSQQVNQNWGANGDDPVEGDYS